MEELNKGSIEILPVEVTDRLASINSLDGFAVSYQINTEDDTNTVVDWTACGNSGMTALPLIDTSTLDKTVYNLRIKVDVPPEHPILGPFEFMVV